MYNGTFYESYLKKLSTNPGVKKHEYTTQFFQINLSTRSFSYRDSDKVNEIKCIHTGKDLIDYHEQLEELNLGMKEEWTYGFSLLTKTKNYILYAQNFESYSKWMIMLKKFFIEPMNLNKENFENFITYEDEEELQILSSINEKDKHDTQNKHGDFNHIYAKNVNVHEIHEESNSKIDISRFFDRENRKNDYLVNVNESNLNSSKKGAFQKYNVYVPPELRNPNIPNTFDIRISEKNLQDKGRGNISTVNESKYRSNSLNSQNSQNLPQSNKERNMNIKIQGSEVTLVFGANKAKKKEGGEVVVKELFSTQSNMVNKDEYQYELKEDFQTIQEIAIQRAKNNVMNSNVYINEKNIQNIDSKNNKNTNYRNIRDKPTKKDKNDNNKNLLSENFLHFETQENEEDNQESNNRVDYNTNMNERQNKRKTNKELFQEQYNNYQESEVIMKTVKEWNDMNEREWTIKQSPQINKNTNTNANDNMSKTTKENLRMEKLLQDKLQRNKTPNKVENSQSLFDKGLHHIKSPMKGQGQLRIAVENLHFYGKDSKNIPIDYNEKGLSGDKKNNIFITSPGKHQRQGDNGILGELLIMDGKQSQNVVKSISEIKNYEFTFNITVHENYANKFKVAKVDRESLLENKLLNDSRARIKAISTKEYEGNEGCNDKEHVMFQRTFKDNKTYVVNEHHMPIKDVIDLQTKIREDTIIAEKLEQTMNRSIVDGRNMMIPQELMFIHEKYTLAEGELERVSMVNLKTNENSFVKESKKDTSTNNILNDKNKKISIFEEDGLNMSFNKNLSIIGKEPEVKIDNSSKILSPYEKRFQSRISAINDLSNIMPKSNNEKLNETYSETQMSKLNINFSALNVDEEWDKSVIEDDNVNENSFFYKK